MPEMPNSAATSSLVLSQFPREGEAVVQATLVPALLAARLRELDFLHR
tara:strand:+ start:196 stop:339 length:144 start_codon:yes stop_codon:yes gene_type:complete